MSYSSARPLKSSDATCRPSWNRIHGGRRPGAGNRTTDPSDQLYPGCPGRDRAGPEGEPGPPGQAAVGAGGQAEADWPRIRRPPRNPAKVLPGPDEIRKHVRQIGAMLREAAQSDDPADWPRYQDHHLRSDRRQDLGNPAGRKETKQGLGTVDLPVRAYGILAQRCGFPAVEEGDQSRSKSM